MYGSQQERGYERASSPSPRGRLHDGVREFMNGVYLWMAAGVAITGVVAWGIASRPEIMQMVTRMDPSLQLSREESLRSFGQLLRQGTIQKLQRRFANFAKLLISRNANCHTPCNNSIDASRGGTTTPENHHCPARHRSDRNRSQLTYIPSNRWI